jgi:hypothetical protein
MSDFQYKQRTFALDDLEGQTKALHEDGFALIPGVLNAQEVKDVRDAIDRLRPFGFDHVNVNEHYKCVFNRDRLFLDMLDRPGIVDLAESTMGAQCHIIGSSAWRSHPGHNGWSPHTDHTLVSVPEEVRVTRRRSRSTFAPRTIIWTTSPTKTCARRM